MDLFVLLTFTSFFLVLAVRSTIWPDGLAVRRPGLFRLLALAAAAVLVPLDLYAGLYDTQLVGGTVLLLNVAACCGLAALAGQLPTGGAGPRMGVLGWVGPLVALVALGAIVTIDPARDGPELGAVGPAWAFYSVLICLFSGYALRRGRAREASDPQEG